MLPLIKESTQSGYAIAVLNPNVNKGNNLGHSKYLPVTKAVPLKIRIGKI